MLHVSKFAVSSFVLGLALLSSSAVPVYAQKVRDSVSRHQSAEKGFFESSRTSRHINNARTYSSDVYRYARAPQPVTPQVLKSESTLLGQEIAHAQRESVNLGTVLKPIQGQAESLKTLNGHLDAAAAKHKELTSECMKDNPDPMKCAMCASQITKELDKAHAEHEAIVRETQMMETAK